MRSINLHFTYLLTVLWRCWLGVRKGKRAACEVDCRRKLTNGCSWFRCCVQMRRPRHSCGTTATVASDRRRTTSRTSNWTSICRRTPEDGNADRIGRSADIRPPTDYGPATDVEKKRIRNPWNLVLKFRYPDDWPFFSSTMSWHFPVTRWRHANRFQSRNSLAESNVEIQCVYAVILVLYCLTETYRHRNERAFHNSS